MYVSVNLLLHVFFSGLLSCSLSSISLPPVDLRSYYISFLVCFFFLSTLFLNKWGLSLDIKFLIDINCRNMIFSSYSTTLSISSINNKPELLAVSSRDFIKWVGRRILSILYSIITLCGTNVISTNIYQYIYFICLQENELFSWNPLDKINLLAPELLLFFLILAHPVYKMWIIQETNTLELWNKLHFEGKKRRVYTMFKIFSTYICWINI